MLITKDDMLNKALKNLEWVLKNRGYPQKLIQENMKKIKNLSQKDVLYHDTPKTDNTQRYLVFLTHYSKDNTTIKKIINKHWHLIENDQELNKIWPDSPIIATMRHKNIKDLLVKARVV